MASHETTSRPAEGSAYATVAQVEQLREVVTSMLDEGRGKQALDVLLDVIGTLHEDNARLTYRLGAAIRARYGRSSERLTAEELGQLVLAWGATEQQAAQVDPDVPAQAAPTEEGEQKPAPKPRKRRRRRRHRGRSQLDPKLPRVITQVPVLDADRNCIHCGEPMDVIGHVDHERVEFIPARIEVHVERREKVACKHCEQDIATAQRRTSKPYARRAGSSLLAHLLESKCDDALPVYRQQDQFRRLGFDAPLNTLYGYWSYATQVLTPLADVIVSTVLAESVVGVDDTRLDYLDPGDPRGIQRGHLWCFVGTGPLVAFTFTESWSAADIDPWLSAVDGFIQCDDYKGYGSTLVAPDGSKRVLVPPERRLGCLMHVRRRFYKAHQGGQLLAAVPLELIREIYALEEHAKAEQLEPEQRLSLRQSESLPLLDQFDSWVDGSLPKLRPSDPLAKAARYAHQQRPFIRRCFSDGRFEIDNGRVERQIREPAVGRKNFLFSGSAEAAARLAAAYTVVLSARHTGLNVREYLVDVLDKLEDGWKARRIGELLPAPWAALHQAGPDSDDGK